MAGYPFQGASGRHYNYGVVNTENNQIPTLGPGNFILARSGYAPEPIYIGEADSVYGILTRTNLWELANIKYGANVLYVHLNPDQPARTAEWGDLVAKWNPPMNA